MNSISVTCYNSIYVILLLLLTNNIHRVSIVSHEHKSPLILGFPSYGEHSSCVLWTFWQTIVNQYIYLFYSILFYRNLFLLEDHHVVTWQCNVMTFQIWKNKLQTTHHSKAFMLGAWEVCLYAIIPSTEQGEPTTSYTWIRLSLKNNRSKFQDFTKTTNHLRGIRLGNTRISTV